jgi:acetyl esterase/lipase
VSYGFNEVTPFHPELRTSAALFRFFLPLGLLRALYRLRGVPRPPRVAGLEIHDRHFSAGDGETLRVRIYRRAGSTGAGPALLWIHGGGYVMGSPELHEKSSVDFARTLGVTVVAVSYRVAPKWPFPTPLHDCYSALCWMHRHAGELGIDQDRIAVYGWTAYLGQSPGQPEVEPYSVPARRECLRGLPPAWIGVGDCDLFFDEDIAYARRLSASGVQCKLNVVPGAYHGFDIVRSNAGVTRAFSRKLSGGSRSRPRDLEGVSS